MTKLSEEELRVLGVPAKELFAAQHCDQWHGCVSCKESHHEDNFCGCGACFFKSDFKQDPQSGYTFGTCYACNLRQIWD